MRRWNLWSGFALLTGATLLIVKSAAILATGEQPDLLFEVSPLFLGLGVLVLAPALGLQGARRVVVSGLGLLAVAASLVAWATEVVGEVLGAALAVAALSAILGAVVAGWHADGEQRRSALLLVGLVVVPAMLVGGALAEIDERLLEVGLLGYAAAWAWAGVTLIRVGRVRNPPRRGTLGPCSG